jgi:hypothetical protein
VPTPFGTIKFHVLPTDTPFLLYLRDMDEHSIRFDNLENMLVQKDLKVPVERRFGHDWLDLHYLLKSDATEPSKATNVYHQLRQDNCHTLWAPIAQSILDTTGEENS